MAAELKDEGVTSKKQEKKTEEKKKIGSRPSPVRALSTCHALSGPGSTDTKRGVKHEDVEFITRAKRVIQQKHMLSLQHTLSTRSECAKCGVSC